MSRQLEWCFVRPHLGAGLQASQNSIVRWRREYPYADIGWTGTRWLVSSRLRSFLLEHADVDLGHFERLTPGLSGQVGPRTYWLFNPIEDLRPFDEGELKTAPKSRRFNIQKLRAPESDGAIVSPGPRGVGTLLVAEPLAMRIAASDLWGLHVQTIEMRNSIDGFYAPNARVARDDGCTDLYECVERFVHRIDAAETQWEFPHPVPDGDLVITAKTEMSNALALHDLALRSVELFGGSRTHEALHAAMTRCPGFVIADENGLPVMLTALVSSTPPHERLRAALRALLAGRDLAQLNLWSYNNQQNLGVLTACLLLLLGDIQHVAEFARWALNEPWQSVDADGEIDVWPQLGEILLPVMVPIAHASSAEAGFALFVLAQHDAEAAIAATMRVAEKLPAAAAREMIEAYLHNCSKRRKEPDPDLVKCLQFAARSGISQRFTSLTLTPEMKALIAGAEQVLASLEDGSWLDEQIG